MVDKRFKDAGPRDLARLRKATKRMAASIDKAMKPFGSLADALSKALPPAKELQIDPKFEQAYDHYKLMLARGERGDEEAGRKAQGLGDASPREAAHYFDLYGPHKGAPGRPRGPRGKQFADTDAAFEAEAKQRIATGEAIAEVIKDIASQMEGASLEAKKKRLRRALRSPQSEP